MGESLVSCFVVTRGAWIMIYPVHKILSKTRNSYRLLSTKWNKSLKFEEVSATQPNNNNIGFRTTEHPNQSQAETSSQSLLSRVSLRVGLYLKSHVMNVKQLKHFVPKTAKLWWAIIQHSVLQKKHISRILTDITSQFYHRARTTMELVVTRSRFRFSEESPDGLGRWAFSHCIHCTDVKLVFRAGLKQVDGNWAFWYWCWDDSGPRRLDEPVDVVANHRWTAVVLRSIPRQRARTVRHLAHTHVLSWTRQLYTTTPVLFACKVEN